MFYQGVPLLLEEGRYSDVTTLAMPTNVASIKYIDVDFGTPELHLNSSTNFRCKENWTKAFFIDKRALPQRNIFGSKIIE